MSGWVRALAGWLAAYPADRLPPEVLRMGAVLTLDSAACALGARDHEAAHVVKAVVGRLGGAAECSLIGSELESGGAAGAAGGRSSLLNAILHNGTLIRALDCNDILFRNGIAGHPSDNIAVALACAEAEHQSGREYLRALALGYELYYRLREHVYAPAPGYAWDHVSKSGLVGAAMAGLLLGLEVERLAEALAIGGAQTYSLAELRGGEISMLKASSNAITAQAGVLGALLAEGGMSGPPELLEGRKGLLAAFGLRASAELLAALTAPIDEWHILETSIKPYPAIGTSQSFIAAALELAREHCFAPAEIEQVEIRFPDLPITREQIADESRLDPRTRETADHSFPFLVAAALEDGELGPAQFADQRWLRASTRALMAKVSMSVDPRLNAYVSSGYPAAVTVQTRSGQRHQLEMAYTPGSPRNPFSEAQLFDKVKRIAGPVAPPGYLEELRERLLGVAEVDDVASLGPLLRGRAGS